MPISTPIDLIADYGHDPDHFNHVLNYLFKPALARAKYDMMAPIILSSQIIQAEIIQRLEEADLVLCDMSRLNANVFFELGIRVALDRPVALVKDNKTGDIPFDNALVGCYIYDASIAPWRLEVQIDELAEFVRSAGKQEHNALWKYFGITKRANASEVADPVQQKLDLILASLRRDQVSDQTLTSRVQDIIAGLGLTQTDYSVGGDRIMHIPQVVSVTVGPPVALNIQTLPGQTPDDFSAIAPAIAYNLGVTEVRVIPLGPSLIRLELLA